jgi:hypothetical protein
MLTQYTRNKDFSDDALNNVGGRSTVDCAGLDSELDEVKTILDEARTYFAFLLRDDLTQIISADSINYIAASLNSTAFVWQGQWLTVTDYLVNNMVFEAGASYICVVTHTSGVFATDLAAGKWELLAQQGSATALPAQGGNANKVLTTDGSNPSWASPQTLANSNTPAGNIVATTIQGAVNELDTEKAAITDAVMDGDAAGGMLAGNFPNPSLAIARALLYSSVNFTVTQSDYDFPFDSEIYKTHAAIHNTVSNKERLVVPSGLGITHAKLKGQTVVSANATGTNRHAQIWKNGNLDSPIAWVGSQGTISASITAVSQIETPLIPVVAGDYFTLHMQQDSGGNLTGFKQNIFFSVEFYALG